MPRTIAVFAGSTSATGTELWGSDGTAVATGLIADIVPGPSSSGPGSTPDGNTSFVPVGIGEIVFAANDGVSEVPELFVSNGTATGTKELYNGFVGTPQIRYGLRASLLDFTSFGNGRVLFAGSTGLNSLGLWTTDGTIAGTSLVRNFGVDLSTSVSGITALGNGKAVFEVGSSGSDGSGGFWVSDATAAGTLKLSTTISSAVSLGNGKALTEASDGSGGSLLGITDGTAGGTATIYDFAVRPGDILPIGGGRALLAASDGLAGQELWVSDGTAAGTVKLVQGPAPALNGSFGFDLPRATSLGDGRFLFSANDGTSQSALWMTDGTAAGTALVADFAPPSGTGYFIDSISKLSDGKALVSVSNFLTGLSALVATDGTAAGTVQLQGFLPYAGKFSVLGDVAVLSDGRAVFSVTDPVGQNSQLWGTDGTPSGTAEILDFAQTASIDTGNLSFTVLPNGHALFRFYHTDGTGALWSTGGTAASTGPVANVMLYGSLALATVPDIDPLFDSNYYSARNPDVGASSYNAYQHFIAFGGAEGRSPDPLFDSKYYLAQNPDVAAAGVNPLLHFETFGWHEGRDPSLLFSDSKYLAANPDVAASGMDPLAHYLQYGQHEGRLTFLSGGVAPADPLVNAAFYDPQLGAALIPSGDAAAQQAAWNYNTIGWTKGLNPDALFDTKYYLSRNPDIAAAHIDPLAHYEQQGWKEGRDPSAAFSTNRYLAANPDVAAARVDPLLHYLVAGQAEGRAVYPA